MKQLFVFSLFLITLQAQAIPLVNGLGGVAGFGENSLPATNDDDLTSSAINITSVFSSGLNFYGTTYNSIYINTNGNVTLNSPERTYTASRLTGSTDNPIFAPFFADVDMSGGSTTATPGGNSIGSNMIHWDLDEVAKKVTVTWDDVGYYKSATDKLNAFQLILTDIDGLGDFGIEFRYENINWTTGDASGGENGLGGTVARAGWSSGNGEDFFELVESGNEAQMLNLENTSNIGGQVGSYRFTVTNGNISVIPVPAAVWLFGSSLIGLVGLRKRAKSV